MKDKIIDIEVEEANERIWFSIEIEKAINESVQLVITEDIDEMITHNIFYTAITRK